MNRQGEPVGGEPVGRAADLWRRHRASLVLGLLAVLVLVLSQLAMLSDNQRLIVVPWLALAPLVVSLTSNWRPTAVVAAGSVAAVALLSALVNHGDVMATLLGGEALVRIAGSTALAVFAVGNAVVRHRREERIRRVTAVATVAQASILHPVPARVGGLRVASRYVSASADAQVGGDLFDAIDTPAGVRLLIGDVRGKGLTALRTASAVLAGFRHLAPSPELGLAEVATQMERALLRDLDEEDFVTVALCQVDAAGEVEVVNCGHPAPLLICPDGTVRELTPSRFSAPLGLGVDPATDRFTLTAGQRLLLHTDGLSESRDAAGRFLDLSSACAALASRGGSVDAALDQLLHTVRRFSGNRLGDDLGILLLELQPRSAGDGAGQDQHRRGQQQRHPDVDPA